MSSQRRHRVHHRRAQRRHVARQHRCGNQAQTHGDVRQRVDRTHLEEQRPHQPRQRDCRSEPARNPDRREAEAVAHEHAGHFLPLGAERHADADLARALGNGVRNHAVNPCHTEQQRHRPRDRQDHQRERRPRHRRAHDLIEGAHARQRQARIQRPHRAAHLRRLKAISGIQRDRPSVRL